jgi:hypothetical protein
VHTEQVLPVSLYSLGVMTFAGASKHAIDR